jgi:hypothetical protein
MDWKYRIFVASSVAGIEIARAIQSELQHDFEVSLWNQNILIPSRTTIESLQEAADSYDFGVFVFSPDDVLEMKGARTRVLAARDNVLFECGLFFSSIGSRSCFFLVPRDIKNFRIPTDLWGITPAFYGAQEKPRVAVGAPCNEIRQAIREITRGDIRGLSLSGKWNLEWSVPQSKRFKKSTLARTDVRHIGNRFLATCNDRFIPFEIRGEVRNGRYITGTWSQSELNYFGAFQIIASPKGDKMVGTSVGFSSDGHVLPGTWKWNRVKETR